MSALPQISIPPLQVRGALSVGLGLASDCGDRKPGATVGHDMEIRKAQEADLPALLDIYNYEVEHGTATFDLHPKTMKERRTWFEEHPGGRYILLAAIEDGRAVGYASLSPYREKEAYAATVELSIYVDVAYRGCGIADQLMQELLSYAKAREDVHTIVSVITEGNETSVRLHEKYGFLHCGCIHEVGVKFGKPLGIVNMELIV